MGVYFLGENALPCPVLLQLQPSFALLCVIQNSIIQACLGTCSKLDAQANLWTPSLSSPFQSPIYAYPKELKDKVWICGKKNNKMHWSKEQRLTFTTADWSPSRRLCGAGRLYRRTYTQFFQL